MKEDVFWINTPVNQSVWNGKKNQTTYKLT